MDDDGVERVPHTARVFEDLLDYARYTAGSFGRILHGLPLHEIVALAEPGDILLFRGRGVVAWGQELTTGARVSHVAIVARMRNHAGEEVLGYAEADRHRPAANELDAEPTCCIHFAPLELCLQTYLERDGLEVSLRKLQLYVENPLAVRARLNNVIVAVTQRYNALNTPFTTDLVVFIGVAYPWLAVAISFLRYIAIAHGGEDAWRAVLEYQRARGVFCSRFVTECFVEAGLFEPPTLLGPHHGIAPAHFTETGDPALTTLKRARRAGGPRNSALPWARAAERVFGFGPQVFAR
jgi:hypothetical protein